MGVAWVAQLAECPTLDFGSGHDLRVPRLSPVFSSMPKILSPSPPYLP